MKFIPIFLALVLFGCAVSQFTMYKPSDNETAWKIEVKTTGNTYTLIVDGRSVVEGSFSFLGKDFQASGEFKGKNLKMFGYRRYIESVAHDQIRVLINDAEVTKFDF
jgi:hypothetical protein